MQFLKSSFFLRKKRKGVTIKGVTIHFLIYILRIGGVATIREEPDVEESGQERPRKSERKKAGRKVKKRAAGHSES